MTAQTPEQSDEPQNDESLDEQATLWSERVRLCVWLMVGLLLVSLWPFVSTAFVYIGSLLNVGVGIYTANLLAVFSGFIPPLQLLFGFLLYAFLGFPFVVRALIQLRHRSLTMDTLIAIGVTAAFGHGVYQVLFGTPSRFCFMDVGMIAGFVSYGRSLEIDARRRATRAVSRLVTLTPPTATVLEGDGQVTKSIADIAVGDALLIKPGVRIPLDASVVAGESKTDESWLTGESGSVKKSSGDPVYAGSLNLSGALTAQVTSTSDATYLSRIIELVRTAQSSKATVQRLADRAAHWFVPAVLLVAVVTLLVWGVALDDWNEAVQRAVAVLIVSCPCALGLAAPTAILAACQRGAQEGILIKDAQALETAGRLSCILLDQTPAAVQVAVDGQHVDRITLQSATDPYGRKAVKKLRQLGLVTMIVPGDSEEISNDVGAEIDVDRVGSQGKPNARHDLVKKMQAAGHCVAMVGDGINDAPALAAADLGVAMGGVAMGGVAMGGVAMGSGADADLEAADVVLTRADMRQLLTVVNLARATRSTIRWNLVWAVGYNLCLIPLASGLMMPLIAFIPFGWLWIGRLTLPPSLAAAAMAASRLSVVTNSVRLATRTDI